MINRYQINMAARILNDRKSRSKINIETGTSDPSAFNAVYRSQETQRGASTDEGNNMELELQEASDSINSQLNSSQVIIRTNVKPLLLNEVMKEGKMLIDSSEVELSKKNSLVRVTDMQHHQQTSQSQISTDRQAHVTDLFARTSDRDKSAYKNNEDLPITLNI